MRVEGRGERTNAERLTSGPIGNQLPRFWLADSKLLQEDAKPTRTLRYSAASGFKGPAPAMVRHPPAVRGTWRGH